MSRRNPFPGVFERTLACAVLVSALFAAGCASGPRAGRRTGVPGTSAGYPAGTIERGDASWYGRELHGRRTASGERFDMNALTAAHRRMPFGTRVRVTNLATGRSVVVRVNDRGPYGRGRIIDVSREAARRIGIVAVGRARVEVEVLGGP